MCAFWFVSLPSRVNVLWLYVIGQVQVMVWIGPNFVHASDVSRLCVDGDIFAYIWLKLYVRLGSSWALVRTGALFFSESKAFYGVWLVASSISSALFSFILLR